MSKSELLATHNRDLYWITKSRKVKVRDMSTEHLKALVPILELRERRNACYDVFHPRRRFAAHAEYQLRTIKAEIEWRNRNGLL